MTVGVERSWRRSLFVLLNGSLAKIRVLKSVFLLSICHSQFRLNSVEPIFTICAHRLKPILTYFGILSTLDNDSLNLYFFIISDSATYVGNILKINSVKKEHRGTYYCVADNGVSKGDRRNINLEVEFAPVVSIPRPRLGQALQYDMDLECHIEAYPPPAVVWTKDDIVLSNNQHYAISHFATADEFTDSTLRVITIEKRQYGDYVCKAVNKLGQAEAKVNLFETVVPVCPPACGQAYFGGAGYLAASSIILAAVILASMFSS